MNALAKIPAELPTEGEFLIAESALFSHGERPSVVLARVQEVCAELMRRGYTVYYWFSHEDMAHHWRFKK